MMAEAAAAGWNPIVRSDDARPADDARAAGTSHDVFNGLIIA